MNVEWREETKKKSRALDFRWNPVAKKLIFFVEGHDNCEKG